MPEVPEIPAHQRSGRLEVAGANNSQAPAVKSWIDELLQPRKLIAASIFGGVSLAWAVDREVLRALGISLAGGGIIWGAKLLIVDALRPDTDRAKVKQSAVFAGGVALLFLAVIASYPLLSDIFETVAGRSATDMKRDQEKRDQLKRDSEQTEVARQESEKREQARLELARLQQNQQELAEQVEQEKARQERLRVTPTVPERAEPPNKRERPVPSRPTEQSSIAASPSPTLVKRVVIFPETRTFELCEQTGWTVSPPPGVVSSSWTFARDVLPSDRRPLRLQVGDKGDIVDGKCILELIRVVQTPVPSIELVVHRK